MRTLLAIFLVPLLVLPTLAGAQQQKKDDDMQGMPGMNGMQFLKSLREIDLEVPIVLMTGGPTLETAIQAVEYGAFRYLRKPVAARELQDTLTRAARYHSLARLKKEALAMTGGALDKGARLIGEASGLLGSTLGPPSRSVVGA